MSFVLMFARRPLVVACLAVVSACAEGDRTVPSTTNLVVNVAPLTLPGLSDVCYGITVENEVPQLVWSRSNICSQRFGNGAGGDISYVGPCDSQEPLHAVTLTIESVTDANGLVLGAGDWVNPCPPGEGCVLDVACEENADTPVTFNLTVMRNAKQGFFDLAVEFEDVFCSGKIDCVDSSGEPIELLHNRDGVRDATVVVALACTGGPGADVDSQIHMSDIRIECGGERVAMASEVEVLFGSCYDAGDGDVVMSAGLIARLGELVTTPEGWPQLVPDYWRLFQYNGFLDGADGATWNANAVSVSDTNGVIAGADEWVVYTRLGANRAIVVGLDHSADYAPSSPIPDLGSLDGISIATATFTKNTEGLGGSWVVDTGSKLAPPTGLTPIYIVPERFDGEWLQATVAGADGFGTAVYRWNGSAFGAGTLLPTPALAGDQEFAWETLRDGAAIGFVMLPAATPTSDDHQFDVVSVWAVTADGGWTDLTQLTVPDVVPDGYVVPANHVMAGYALSDAAAGGSHEPVLLTGQKVAFPTTGTLGEDTRTVTGLFEYNAVENEWFFSVHPVYADHFATVTALGASVPTEFEVRAVLAYGNHHALRLVGDSPDRMFRVYRNDGAFWNQYPTTTGEVPSQMNIVSVIERPASLGGGAFALFEFKRDDTETGRWLELAYLDPTAPVVATQRSAIPLEVLAGPAMNFQAWNLAHVDHAADAMFLTFENGNSNNFASVVFRVAIPASNAVPTPDTTTATQLTIISADLSGLWPRSGGQFSERMFESGDATSFDVPGGCVGQVGYTGDVGAIAATGATATTSASRQTAATVASLDGITRHYGYMAAVNFTGAAETYTAATIPWGDATLSAIQAADAAMAATNAPTMTWLEPSAVEGNQLVASGIPVTQPVWQHAVYAGNESLNCGGSSCNKVFYNTAIGFDALEPNCWLNFEATASGGGVVQSNGMIPDGWVYPVLVGSVQLTGEDPADGLMCTQHPLGSPGFGVTYTQPFMRNVGFCYTWDGTQLVSHIAADEDCGYRTQLSLRQVSRTAEAAAVGTRAESYAPAQREARELPPPDEPLP